MIKLRAHALALMIGLVFSVGAMAQAMTKLQHKSAQADISADYKVAKAACSSLVGNAQDVCQAQARGKQQVATAQLKAAYTPSETASYQVRLARADANLALAVEECDDLVGNVKDVCVKEAKARAITAKVNAKVHMKTAMAHDAAYEKASKAQGVADTKASQALAKADEISAVARNDAATEMRVAALAVAKEKCDALAGDAKGNCIKDATARFNKP
ncbi:hypothetical protein [Rhodoferax sp.]|uniref:hypothetical protein n=1 Tax=Rhodoferax sp. TaxID=50421 RepID=UPI0018034B9F|nr:hypothetical protein [Rhodoferax sp.]MBA3056726.1 hypothetical protein [Rhodoferax sp.]